MKKSFKFYKIFSKGMLFYIMAVFGILVFSGLIFAAYGKIADSMSSSQQPKQYTIVLDAGHGGEDGGAVGIDGIYEKNINLFIATKLKNLLEIAGYNVIMTRDEDKAIYDNNAGTLKQKKKSDLKNRLNMIKSNSNENTVFISIHQNKFTDSKYSGSQIFYSKNNPLSQELANYIRKSIIGLVQPDNTREIKPADKTIFLLHNASIPAVIVECGFLSNSEEARKLISEEYQEQMAFCIFCGAINYFTNL